jgi:sulfite reductase alpha subunit-like flavoprotein
MPTDVRKAVREVIMVHGGKSEEEANSMLSLMERKGRYVVEAWS